jgi:hypothetical protein
MATRGGLFIDIEGEVSSKLLMGMERLKERLQRVSTAAWRLSTTAKATGNIQLGRDIDGLAKEVQGAADSIDDSVEQIGESMQKYWYDVDSAAAKTVRNVAGYNEKIKKSMQPEQFDLDKLKRLGAYNDLLVEYRQHLGNTAQAELEARKRSKELADQTTRLYRSMREVGAVGEGQETLEEFADGMDLAKVRALELRGEIKSTKNGFRAFSNEARDALGLEQWQLEELSGKFASTEEKVTSLRKNIKRFQDDLDKLDPSDEIGFEQARKRATELNRELNKIKENVKEEYGEETFDDLEKSVIRANKGLEEHKARVQAVRKAEQDWIKTKQKSAESIERMRKMGEYDFELFTQGQLKQAKTEINALNKELYRLQNNFSAEEYDDFAKTLDQADAKITSLTGKSKTYNKTAKQTTNLLTRLWRGFDRLSHVIIRQVHLWGILGAVTVGAQAAYAALGVAAMKAATSIEENAAKLNMSVQSMQKLQGMASLTGTRVKDMREALEELNTTILDAIEGKEEATEAFQNLGIEFETLVKKGNNTKEMFDLVMDRMSKVESSAKRINIAQEIFGEGPASTLINLTGNMEEASKAVEQFDLMLSEKLIDSASAVWRKIRALWFVIKRQFIKAAAEGSGVVENFADQLLALAAKGNLFKGTIVPAIKSTVAIFKALLPLGKALYTVIHLLSENMRYVGYAVQALAGYGVVTLFTRMKGAIMGSVQATGLLNGALITLRKTIKTVGKAAIFYYVFEAIQKVYNKIVELNDFVKKMDVSWKQAGLLAAEQFTNAILKGLATLGTILIGAMSSIQEPIAAYGTSLGAEFAKSFIDTATGGMVSPQNWNKPLEAFRKSFVKNLKETRDKVSDIWSLGDIVQFADDETRRKYQKYLQQMKEEAKDFSDIDMPEFKGGQQNNQTLREMVQNAELATGKVDSLIGKLEEFREAGKVSEVQDILPFAQEEVESKIQKVRNQIELVNEAMSQAPTGVGLGDSELAQKLKKLQLRLEELKKTQEEINESMQTARINEWADNFETRLDDINSRFKKGTDRWKGAVRSFLDDFRTRFSDMPEEVQNQMKKLYRQLVDTPKEIFQQGRQMAQLRRDVATAGIPEEKQRYEIVKDTNDNIIGQVREIEQTELDSLRTRKNALENYRNRMLQLYDDRLARARVKYGQESDEFKRLQMQRVQFQKETNTKLLDLEDKLARERIKKQGSFWDKLKLGMQNYTASLKSEGEYWVDAAENVSRKITDNLGGALADVALHTKSIGEAWKQLESQILSTITNVMTNYLMQRFMKWMMPGGGGVGGQTTPGAGGINPSGGSLGGGGGGNEQGMFMKLGSLFTKLLGSAHTGGIVGKDVGVKLDSVNSKLAAALLPHHHTGMRSDEYVSVLQRGEEIRNREQASRDKKSAGQGVNVVNNINVQAPEGKIDKQSMHQLQKKLGRSMQRSMQKDR